MFLHGVRHSVVNASAGGFATTWRKAGLREVRAVLPTARALRGRFKQAVKCRCSRPFLFGSPSACVDAAIFAPAKRLARTRGSRLPHMDFVSSPPGRRPTKPEPCETVFLLKSRFDRQQIQPWQSPALACHAVRIAHALAEHLIAAANADNGNAALRRCCHGLIHTRSREATRCPPRVFLLPGRTIAFASSSSPASRAHCTRTPSSSSHGLAILRVRQMRKTNPRQLVAGAAFLRIATKAALRSPAEDWRKTEAGRVRQSESFGPDIGAHRQRSDRSPRNLFTTTPSPRMRDREVRADSMCRRSARRRRRAQYRRQAAHLPSR